MSTATEHPPTSAPDRRFPPVAQLTVASLALIVVGGIFMASYAPRRPPLALPIGLLVGSVALLAAGIVMMIGQRDFAWDTFFRVDRWALAAYVVSAGMIEFAFVKDHTRGAPLVVLTLMLVMFALDVPMIIAFTVARYQTPKAPPSSSGLTTQT